MDFSELRRETNLFLVHVGPDLYPGVVWMSQYNSTVCRQQVSGPVKVFLADFKNQVGIYPLSLHRDHLVS